MTTPPFQVYAVGGCVRDELLRAHGIAAKTGDRDWVVVGARPEDLTARGFTPVGADFPVFLHPQTHEEYALARTERKTAAGYHGFSFHASPDVTLEEDLRRRDLTINAMARDAQGHLIDPYGGERDLAAHVFRHVSAAFSEDPVRILRLARFAARLPMFTVAPETMELLRSMVNNGEADALVPERVWAELSRGIMEKTPSRMFVVLEECGYWPRAFGAIALSSEKLAKLDHAASAQAPLTVRFALLVEGLTEKDARTMLHALRATNEVIELCALYCRLGAQLEHAKTPPEAARVLEQSDCLRRPERFADFVQAVELSTGRSQERWRHLAQAWSAVDAGAVARTQKDPRSIATAIKAARVAALTAAWPAA